MASWLDLDQAAPHITRTGRARLNQARMALPGTLRPDGSPRISPAEPYFTDGQLISGLIPGQARHATYAATRGACCTARRPDAGEPS